MNIRGQSWEQSHPKIQKTSESSIEESRGKALAWKLHVSQFMIHWHPIRMDLKYKNRACVHILRFVCISCQWVATYAFGIWAGIWYFEYVPELYNLYLGSMMAFHTFLIAHSCIAHLSINTQNYSNNLQIMVLCRKVLDISAVKSVTWHWITFFHIRLLLCSLKHPRHWQFSTFRSLENPAS